MTSIKHIHGRQILDSRGNPTVEVDLTLSDGARGRASVPSGASTGTHEAHELRDGDQAIYGGAGVTQAVNFVNTEIATHLADRDLTQDGVDTALIELDGTPNKSRLGANAILGVSLAYAHAEAHSQNINIYEYFNTIGAPEATPLLPTPMMNILNGGQHAEDAADFQEFMVVPHGMPTISEAIRCGAEIFHTLKGILKERGLVTAVGDEGGFAPRLESNKATIQVVVEAIEKAGYKPGDDVSIALDTAASEFYRDGMYHLTSENRVVSATELIDYYAELVDSYPIISIEDGLHEDDWEGFTKLVAKIGDRVQLVGDDLFVTNVERLQKGITEKAANSILIKFNQIGTITETIKAVKLAKDSNFTSIISHRSGETEDTTIAHLAVGLAAGQIKTGSLSRSERVGKYNELIRIEESLGDAARFAGKSAFKI